MKKSKGSCNPFCKAVIFIIILLLFVIIHRLLIDNKLAFNITDSMPKGIYSVQEVTANLHKGQKLLFCPSKRQIKLALDRGYVNLGRCPSGSVPLGKELVAIAGDVVEITRSAVSVNGKILPNSSALQADSAGRPLKPYAFSGTLKQDEYLVMAALANSYDGRYFGIIDKSQLLGTLSPLITYD